MLHPKHKSSQFETESVVLLSAWGQFEIQLKDYKYSSLATKTIKAQWVQAKY